MKKFKSRKSLELQDIANLERLKNVIASFELGVHYEIEQITDRGPLLSMSASKLKTYTDYAGLFHPVKLLLRADGHYEIRVNIVENAETRKYEFDDSVFLRGLMLLRELDRILERRKKNVNSSIRRSAKSTQ